MNLTSTLTYGEVQVDGRQFIKEQHTAADGQVIDREYLWDGVLDPQLVMEERAKQIAATLLAREAARLAVVGDEVPWTKYQFFSMFTSAERKAIRAFEQTDGNVMDFIEMAKASGGVYKSLAFEGLMYLAHIGAITFERAEAISEAM